MAKTIYQLLRMDVPEKSAALAETIEKEIDIQRMRLAGLRGVLPNDVLDKKIALLPTLD
jgi:hypothetical protein